MIDGTAVKMNNYLAVNDRRVKVSEARAVLRKTASSSARSP